MAHRPALLALILSLACAAPAAQAPAPPPAPPAVAPTPPAPVPEAPVPELAFPDEPFRAQPPASGEARVLKTPPVQQFKLPGGISVFLVEKHDLPLVSLSLIFAGGSASDPPGDEGRAAVCASLMADGTEKLQKLAFEEELADLASAVNSGAVRDEHFVSMRALTKSLEPTLDLWADTLLRPGMRKEDLDRSLRRAIAALQQDKGNPASVADRLLASIVYGPEHPVGRFPTEASYGKVTLESCKAFVADHVRPQGARLFVVGDISKAEIIDKVGRRLAGWKGRAKPVPPATKPRPRKGRIFFVDMPNAPQSIVYLTHAGPPRTARDYHATTIMNAVLGGGFSSRINMNIREKHGYAYGAGGGFSYTRRDSLYRASASVRTDVTKEAVLEMLKEIRGLRDGEPTDEELVREKDGRVLALPAQFATGGETLQAFRSLVYFGLPFSYFDRFVPEVRAVDRKAVQAAARRHLRPDELQLFVVGDGKQVLPRLRELASSSELKGELVLLDVDGRVLPGAAGN